MATSAANAAGVPVQLFLDQIGIESSWNPAITGASPAADGETAEGIAQFLPSTAASFGINPFDPSQALPAAAKYDETLYAQNGNSWVNALQKYGTLPTSGAMTSAQSNLASLAASLSGNSNVADELGATSGSGAATFGTSVAGAVASPAASSSANSTGFWTGLIPNIAVMVVGVVLIYVGLTRGGVSGSSILVMPKGFGLPAAAASAAA
jgi:soluble lytic murein transglycosylase-like protein